ncbi:MAG: mechanosensitive ion channel family protein [Gemmatimonadetes bacterium]|nr:mechanosensitive ion channel family protein [Gemmatimonadota bacterium]NNK65092.1 mechanosensitive ion channel [Gemmatimonadota bacterium]
MSELLEQIRIAFSQLWLDMVSWTPRLVVGLLLVVAAVVAAKIVERVLRGLLKKIGIDGALRSLGLDAVGSSVGLTKTLSDLIPRFVFYLLLFLFARTAADALGLEPISSAIGTFMAYLPNVLAAALVLVLGGAGAQFAGKAVTRAAEGTGIEFAGSLGAMAGAILLFVVVVTAISQLKIDTEIVRILTWSSLGMLVLAFGLSFGLGTRDITRNIVAGFYARKTFEMGRRVELGGESGRLTAITPTQTLLDDDGTIVAVSNRAFLEQTVRQFPESSSPM